MLKGRKAGAREFFVTVLSLLRCRYLELQNRESGESLLILRDDINKNKLKPHEEYVLNWLTADLGREKGLSLNTLDQILADFGKNHKHKISTWQRLVTQSVSNQNLLGKSSKMKMWGMGAVLIGVIAGTFAWLALSNHWAGLLAGVCALALAGYTILLKPTSEAGEIVKREWLIRKEKLLAKLSDEQNLLPLNKWEEELIYALPLGIAGEILDRLPHLYKESVFEDGNLTILYKNNLPWLSNTLENLK